MREPIDERRGSAYKHGLSNVMFQLKVPRLPRAGIRGKGMQASSKAMTQDARTAAPSRKKNAATGRQIRRHKSARTEPVFQHYEAAVLLLQQGKYERALTALEKLLPEAPSEIKDRCRMYISTCQRQLLGRARSSLLRKNTTTTRLAAQHRLLRGSTGAVRQILNDHPGADYAFYGWRCWNRLPAAPRMPLESGAGH